MGRNVISRTVFKTPVELQQRTQIIRSIQSTKDFDQILGLEKGCTEDDVRKAYRKLSLRVHPDKNKAPGAEEAFKAVSKASQSSQRMRQWQHEE
jgi:DnaJ family protein B protein 12